MNIGAHIPSKNAIDEISYRKGDTFQIFISSPQMWKSCLLYTSDAADDP